MKTIRNMVELSVSYDGKISVKNIDPTHAISSFAYYHYYNGSDDEHGISCYCCVDKKHYHLKRILNLMKKEADEECREAKIKRDKIYAMAQEVKNNETNN